VITALLDRLGLGTRSPSTAEEWLARSKSPYFTPSDQVRLEAWLARDPRHRREYERCLRVSQVSAGMRERLDRVSALSVYPQFQADRRPRATKPFVTSHWLVPLGLAVAASAAVLMFMIPRLGTEDRPTAVATRHGEQRELSLADGSRVYLNTDSAVQVAFSERERRVRLVKGEGFFDVTKDTNRTFVVEAGTTEVRVVGTRFSVRATNAGTDVIVSEGKVEVVPDIRAQSPSAPAKVELIPGNAMRFDRLENYVKVTAVDPERATSWRTGSIRFDGATVEEVIAEVNRYAKTPFVLADDSRVRDIRLSGTFKVGDMESVRFVLRDGYGLDAVTEDGRILIK
jgi:transmembrane sensor